MSMRFKLFMLLIVVVTTMLLGVLIILLLTGTFTAGINESGKYIKNELAHIANDITESYGKLSAETVYLSKNISASIEKKLKEKNLTVKDLQKHTEILEELISDEFQHALLSLQKSKSSGVFIILDATINDKLPNSENSKAGLYIKNMEPNIINSSSPTILMLRGIPSIARENSLNLHSQWKMEFDISNADYYKLPMEKAMNNSIPLSKLYYWSPAFKLPETTEEIMTCSAPLIDSEGNVFGVCGFDISEILFKLAYMPDNHTYNRLFCMFAPIDNNVLKTSSSLFSGGYSSRIYKSEDFDLNISDGKKPLYTYKNSDDKIFMGYHENIKLYPEDSVFSKDKWAITLMVPAEDIRSSVLKLNLQLIFLCLALMTVGIVISLVLSKHYIKPITKGIDLIKSNDLWDNKKTEILEIDDLIEFLSARKESTNKENREQDSNSKILDTFLKNAKSLSPAERSVFNLYVQQYSAKEIAEALFLSINTIKTHTKRIYIKMNVSSREELLLYIEMLKEAGREIK